MTLPQTAMEVAPWIALLARIGYVAKALLYATVGILEIILREEVAHVAAGSRWYRWYCERAGVDPLPRFRELLVEYAGGALHGPFNREARLAAGFDDDELAQLLDLAAQATTVTGR